MLFLCSLDALPALELVYALLGQSYSAFHVVDTNNNSLNLVAWLYVLFNIVRRIIRQLRYWDVSGVLYAQIYLYVCWSNRDNSTGYFITII